MTVESPCLKICTLDPQSRICLACGRSLAEIAGWSAMTDSQRQAVLDRIARERT